MSDLKLKDLLDLIEKGDEIASYMSRSQDMQGYELTISRSFASDIWVYAQRVRQVLEQFPIIRGDK